MLRWFESQQQACLRRENGKISNVRNKAWEISSTADKSTGTSGVCCGRVADVMGSRHSGIWA